MFDIPTTVPAQTVNDMAARHAMTQQEVTTIRLTGRTLHTWRIDNGASVNDVIRDVCTNPADRQIAGAQPNYLYELAQPTVSGQRRRQEPVNSAQYAPDKLKLVDAHRLASGNKVLVALIDSEVDRTHPDLAGAITASFNAASAAEPPHSHGTGMAGAIAAHRNMLGTAPRVGLLTVRAFSATASSAEGTTFNILKGLDWAADQGARVVNMSFAGPPDPRLRDALQKAYNRGMVLIAAAGNAGPNSPPLYPAADPWRHRGDRDRLARCGVLRRQPRHLRRRGGARRRRFRAGPEWRLSALHRDLDCFRRGERRRRPDDRAQSFAHARRRAPHFDGDGDPPWAKRQPRLRRRPRQRLRGGAGGKAEHRAIGTVGEGSITRSKSPPPGSNRLTHGES